MRLYSTILVVVLAASFNGGNIWVASKEIFKSTSEYRKLQSRGIPGVSLMCMLTSNFFFEDADGVGKSLRPSPAFDPVSLSLDYAADPTAFAAYDEYCNSNEGLTLSMNFSASGSGCKAPSLINVPQCISTGCSESDFNAFAFESAQKAYRNYNCEVIVTAESDGDGGGHPLPDVPEDCYNNMASILFSGLYDGLYTDAGVVDESTGSFNGNTTFFDMFQSSCLDAEGRIVTIDTDSPDECLDSQDLRRLPACVHNSCTDDDAAASVIFFNNLEASDNPSCQGFGFTIVERGFIPPSPELPTSTAVKSSNFGKSLIFYMIVMTSQLLR